MTGRLIDITTARNGKQRVTVEIDNDFSEAFDGLYGQELDIEIKKHRRRRSLDANAYAWVLIDKIIAALSLDKVTVYRMMIREIGGVSETVCVKVEAAEKLITGWEHNGLGWSSETMSSKLPGCVNVILYYGSSMYDTAQMSRLIDRLVSEAKELGIPTDTPEQIAMYKSLWEHPPGR